MTVASTQSTTLFHPNNPLNLESGQTLAPVTVAYETYGKLNTNKDNAVLICHALSGDAHASGKNAKGNTGWWDNLIGPKKAIDTNKYFVICTNTIGSCMGSTGPNSINPTTKKTYGLAFPIITIGDMVNVQKQFIEQLGISQLKAVIGGSMGGMQALEWTIMYPESIQQCVIKIGRAHV